MDPSSTLMAGVLSALFAAARLALDVALLVVALTKVRKTRPDASTFLAAAAAAFIVSILVGYLGFYVAMFLLRNTGNPADTMLATQVGVNGIASCLALAGGVLLVLGVLKLASDPKVDTTYSG